MSRRRSITRDVASWLARAEVELWRLLTRAGAPRRDCWLMFVPMTSRRVEAIADQIDGSVGRVLISMRLLDLPRPDMRVLSVMTHELIHVSDGGVSGHTGYFAHIADRVGLLRPYTDTIVGRDLDAKLRRISARIGDLPRVVL